MAKIIIGTTPTIKYTFSEVNVSDLAVAILTCKQHDCVILEKSLTDATVGDKSLSWTLSQAETLKLDTKDDVIWVHIRGQSGKRSGYFYGSDTIFINHQKANSGTSTFSAPAVEYIRVSSSGSYTTATGSYGVYGYSINSSGTVTIRQRYNSTNTLTINDKFDVYVYKLTLPSGKTLFE